MPRPLLRRMHWSIVGGRNRKNAGAGMMARRHLEDREACPLLPEAEEVLTAEATAVFKRDYTVDFYHASLRYAQSLWLEGKAAQSLLQLNKSFMAELDGTEEILGHWPLPYAAKRWVMLNCPPGEFLGNPVRHYQHLATRMSGPRTELRRWRAWGCFHLAESILPVESNPRDEHQIADERIVIPSVEQVLESLERLGLPGEGALLVKVLGT